MYTKKGRAWDGNLSVIPSSPSSKTECYIRCTLALFSSWIICSTHLLFPPPRPRVMKSERYEDRVRWPATIDASNRQIRNTVCSTCWRDIMVYYTLIDVIWWGLPSYWSFNRLIIVGGLDSSQLVYWATSLLTRYLSADDQSLFCV